MGLVNNWHYLLQSEFMLLTWNRCRRGTVQNIWKQLQNKSDIFLSGSNVLFTRVIMDERGSFKCACFRAREHRVATAEL